jgi:hypothetical protein
MTKKPRDEADEITSIRQYLIVNRLIAGCHRRSLDLKDRRTDPCLKDVSNGFGCDHRLQLIICFDQRDSKFFFDKSEDWDVAGDRRARSAPKGRGTYVSSMEVSVPSANPDRGADANANDS